MEKKKEEGDSFIFNLEFIKEVKNLSHSRFK